MNKFLTTAKEIATGLASAIKNGIIRIFPLPRVILYIFAIIVACTLIGCATPKRIYGELGRSTQQVRDTRVDTLYLSNTQYDSIYIYQERLQKDTIFHSPSKGETEGVFIKDVSIEYRYKLLRDTVKVIQRDSIPYEVTIIQTKEITRPLTWYDHLCRISLWFMIGFLTFAIYRFIRR